MTAKLTQMTGELTQMTVWLTKEVPYHYQVPVPVLLPKTFSKEVATTALSRCFEKRKSEGSAEEGRAESATQ